MISSKPVGASKGVIDLTDEDEKMNTPKKVSVPSRSVVTNQQKAVGINGQQVKLNTLTKVGVAVSSGQKLVVVPAVVQSKQGTPAVMLKVNTSNYFFTILMYFFTVGDFSRLVTFFTLSDFFHS